VEQGVIEDSSISVLDILLNYLATMILCGFSWIQREFVQLVGPICYEFECGMWWHTFIISDTDSV
jgi:hypothetical protein